jgi:hypothetical protein
MCLLEILEDLLRHAKGDQGFAQRLQDLMPVWLQQLQQLQPAVSALDAKWTRYHEDPYYVLGAKGPPPPEVGPGFGVLGCDECYCPPSPGVRRMADEEIGTL